MCGFHKKNSLVSFFISWPVDLPPDESVAVYLQTSTELLLIYWEKRDVDLWCIKIKSGSESSNELQVTPGTEKLSNVSRGFSERPGTLQAEAGQ